MATTTNNLGWVKTVSTIIGMFVLLVPMAAAVINDHSEIKELKEGHKLMAEQQIEIIKVQSDVEHMKDDLSEIKRLLTKLSERGI